MRKLIRYSLLSFILGISVILACYAWISVRTNDLIYDDIQQMPTNKIGLVLGTNKYLKGGGINTYYQNRINAAVALFNANKVRFFVVSGDNRQHNYNEPKQMTDDLIAAGIPKENIQPDYAGFRTLDSVLRMHKVFGHDSYVIISQKFHNQRALFLATAHEQSPIAFNASNPQNLKMTRVIIREFLARVKAILDLLVNKEAKFYGDPILFPTH